MIDYTFTKPATIDGQEILDLYQSVGWTAYTQQAANTLDAFENSTVLWATQNNKLVGLCRGITDKKTILYIQDIIVAPEFQRQHIGTNLVQKFLNHYSNIGQTVLITDPEDATLLFYKSLGFLEVTPKEYGRAFVLERRFS